MMLSMIPLPYKIGACAVLLFVVYMGFRQWLNNHDNKVAQETREAVTEEQRIKAEAVIKAEREALAQERKVLEARIDQLYKDKDALYGRFNEAIKQSRKTQAGNAAAVLGIPDAEINSYIRAELARVAAQP